MGKIKIMVEGWAPTGLLSEVHISDTLEKLIQRRADQGWTMRASVSGPWSDKAFLVFAKKDKG